MKLVSKTLALSLMIFLTGNCFSRASGPPPVIVVQPLDQIVLLNGTAVFAVTATSGTTMTYQWRFNGTNISSATDSSYTVVGAKATDQGEYSVRLVNGGGTVTSRNAMLTVVSPPAITRQPSSQSVILGQNALFTVETAGSSPMQYQWSFKGAPISGATTSALSLNNVQTNSAGNYLVVLNNSYGSATSEVAVITVLVPPSISTQPTNLNVALGQTASFSIVAAGSGPLQYRWKFNNNTLIGATNATLNLPNVQTNQSGVYEVVVTNTTGSVTSQSATLLVSVPPGIATPPQSKSVFAGQDTSFFVEAGGTGPFSYQWKFNGAALSNGTKATLQLSSVSTSDAGDYSVIISNAVGFITSGTAALTVLKPISTLAVTNFVGHTRNGFSFGFNVPVGLTYVVQSSTNFQDWVSLSTNLSENGNELFTDTSSGLSATRFYRIKIR